MKRENSWSFNKKKTQADYQEKKVLDNKTVYIMYHAPKKDLKKTTKKQLKR